MSRYALAIRGEPATPEEAITVKEQEIDIYASEQLTEEYLCIVNAKGQVPVLAPPAPASPISDSRKIATYLSSKYPQLGPGAHRDEIEGLLDDLHTLNFTSLSMQPGPGTARYNVLKEYIHDKLQSDISDRYRKALEYKLTVLDAEKINALTEECIQQMVEKAKVVLQHLSEYLPVGGSWLLGLSAPNILDAHVVTFLARLTDAGRTDIIPENLQMYLQTAKGTKEWQSVVPGSTMRPRK